LIGSSERWLESKFKPGEATLWETSGRPQTEVNRTKLSKVKTPELEIEAHR